MTIIEFPKPIQDDLKQENFKRQQQYHTSHALKYDSFEFEDYEIQDTPKKSFFSRLGDLISKKPNIPHLTQEQAYKKSQIVQFDAMGTRIEVEKLLFKAAGNDYKDMEFTDGRRIGFEEDKLGRLIMIENDQYGNCTRETTFIPYTDEIIKIEEAATESGKINKIAFFNDNHFEVVKGIKQNFRTTTKDEVFVFKRNEPARYSNNIVNNGQSETCGDYYDF